MARAQLLATGLTRAEVDHRLKTGHLHRVHRGVYFVGHGVRADQARLMAALLASGPTAVLSHRSAALVWGLPAGRLRPVEVTVAGSHRPRSGIVTIRRRLAAEDIVRVDALILTSAILTVCDLAAVESVDVVEKAIADALFRKLITEAELSGRVTQMDGVRGVGALREITGVSGPGGITRSGAERALRGLIARSRLPAPAINAPLGRFVIDFLWIEQRVVVEADGWGAHASRRSFEGDRRRDAELSARGYLVLRFTGRLIRDQPETVIAQLATVLEKRSTK